jgi:MFS family permease
MTDTTTPSFSIVEAALAGPRLIRRKPMVFLAWVGFQLLALAAYAALLILLFGTFFQTLFDSLSKQAEPPAELFLSLIPRFGIAFLIIVPAAILYLAVTRAAPARAYVRPEDDRFGYLRISVEEWRVFAVIFVVGCINVALQIALGLVAGIIALMLIGLTGGFEAGPFRQVIINQLASLMTMPVLIFFYLKFALAVPETLDQRRISIFNTWRLTKGVTWRMFLSYLIVSLMSLALVIVLVLAAIGVMVAIGFNVADLPRQFETDPNAAFRQMAALFVPIMVVVGVISAIVTPLFNALYLCPAAYIYRAITGRTEDVFA